MISERGSVCSLPLLILLCIVRGGGSVGRRRFTKKGQKNASKTLFHLPSVMLAAFLPRCDFIPVRARPTDARRTACRHRFGCHVHQPGRDVRPLPGRIPERSQRPADPAGRHGRRQTLARPRGTRHLHRPRRQQGNAPRARVRRPVAGGRCRRPFGQPWCAGGRRDHHLHPSMGVGPYPFGRRPAGRWRPYDRLPGRSRRRH